MAFTGISLTENGVKALNKAQGGIELNFIRAAIGDGVQAKPDNEATELANELFSLQISGKSIEEESCILEIDLNNTMSQQDYYFRELGIYAECDGMEVLYAYVNAGDKADLIPASGNLATVEKRIRVSLQIGNASNITIAGKSVLYLSSADEMKEEQVIEIYSNALGISYESGEAISTEELIELLKIIFS